MDKQTMVLNLRAMRVPGVTGRETEGQLRALFPVVDLLPLSRNQRVQMTPQTGHGHLCGEVVRRLADGRYRVRWESGREVECCREVLRKV